MDTQPTPQNPGFTGEQRPEVRPETAAGVQPESARRSVGEAQSQQPAGASGPGVPMPTVPTPQSAQPTSGSAPATPTVTGPATAADVDVIEPEWVDKAEQVIKASQGDPYSEEAAVEDLQQDYLKKRYGHNVEDANSDTSKPGVS